MMAWRSAAEESKEFLAEVRDNEFEKKINCREKCEAQL